MARARNLAAINRRITGSGLTLDDLAFLLLLRDAVKPPTTTEIMHALGLTLVATHRMLTSFTTGSWRREPRQTVGLAKIIETAIDPEDRRRQRVFLTTEGHKLVDEILEALDPEAVH